MIDNRLRFRLITIASNEELFHVVERGMRDAATALNVDADLVGTHGFDIEDVIRLVRSAVHDGIDGIGLNVFHPTALAGVIAEAGAAGVPVVAFNIDAAKTGSGNLSYIMQDFFAAGTVLGHRAAASVADGEHIIVAIHDDGVGALEERAAGIEAGLASREDIDEGMKLGCGHPMGPLTLLDFVGLDTTYFIAQIMFDEFKDPMMAPPPLLKRMVLAGHLGRKSGRGFYDYSSGTPK